ncbi:rhodanese-like domain-containing protein [Ureibacillus sp. FSL K6-8385]|uniref:Rhodanese-like domain-containing protein n=1 Tax=Ureibacillus terrenus TaxID=118246 RepID=A0A540V5B9_9BACL|nr:rhodanese-like domain-containing protein [Ureibacillus terrenus]MED3661158.1 rhodanese-like domain-containing protein [Ureibacillus terrenus]MED3764365.1 rhodanese-like domain-containing protein [Ureibacillus terrenus]TQE91960.1 rhodanese-like domain-containing protein [Ureibacillus terrenus]
MKEITPKEVQQRLEAGEALNIIDVREVHEYASGHIPGAVNIPLGLLPVRMNELSKDIPYIVVCLAGGRSAQATELLDRNGFDATNMSGGMSAWEGKVE